MAFLKIYFNGTLRSTVELRPGATTIGRRPDNDIVIDNVGVSAYHAKIVERNGEFAIEDLNSTNGVFVNDARVERQPLNYGDTITVFKHTLRFSAVGLDPAMESALSVDTHAITQGETVQVDVSKIRELLKARNSDGQACLVRIHGAGGQRRYPLSNAHFSIGRGADADLQAGGWFSPKLAATVRRQSDGYYVLPERRGKVLLNGKRVFKPARLRHGDRLGVRGAVLKFLEQPDTQ